MNERPNQGEQLAGIGGVALILIMFLFAWYEGAGFGLDAFDALRDWVNIILVFTAFAGMELWVFGSRAARINLPAPLSTITAALGALSAVLILIYIISTPSAPFGGGFDLGVKIGAWLGLISAAVVAFGGYLAMQGERMPPAGSRRTRPPAEPPPASPPPPPPPPSPGA